MDYINPHLKAVVDWIEIEIHTEKPTKFQTIQNILREVQNLPASANPHVESLNKMPGGVATVFRFRIQDPERLGEVKRILKSLSYVGGNLPTFRVNEIEVSLDAYNSNPEYAARFYRFATNLISKNHRLYREFKFDKVQAIPRDFNSLIEKLSEGWNIGIGDRDTDDVYQHIYWKTTDNNGQTILVSEYRARIEVTLRGAALPCQTLDDWESFNFGALSRFFNFRKLKDDLNAFDQTITDASPQIGHKHTRNRKEGGTLLHSRLVQADTTLNERARDALRELSRRWKATPKAKKRRAPTVVLDKSACGNPGEYEEKNTIKTKKPGRRLITTYVTPIHTSVSTDHCTVQSNEAQRADYPTKIINDTIEHDSLRSSRTIDSNEVGSDSMETEMLRISRLMEFET